MVLESPTALAQVASGVVAVVSATMAYLGWKSYRATANVRLVFVVLAFVVFAIKSLFVTWVVAAHTVPHDAIEFVSAVLDLVIVLLFFTPFFLAGRG